MIAAFLLLAIPLQWPKAGAPSQERLDSSLSRHSALKPSSARMEQRLGAEIPKDASFIDENGATVIPSRSLGGKPAILVFAYYRCPNLCTLVLNGLADAINHLPLRLGRDYNILTVSIHAPEKPPLALMKKRTYLARLEHAPRGDGATAWRFLTGTEASIRALASSVGFHFAWDPDLQEYVHPSGLIILSPEGKVSGYLPGIQFPSQELEAALRLASRGALGRIAEKVFLSCFHYDPASGKYSVRILGVIRLSGALMALMMLGGFWLLRALERRRAVSP